MIEGMKKGFVFTKPFYVLSSAYSKEGGEESDTGQGKP